MYELGLGASIINDLSLLPGMPAYSQKLHEGHDAVLQADLHILKQEAVLAAAQRVQHRLVLRTAASEATHDSV